jgi:plasmid stability protein
MAQLLVRNLSPEVKDRLRRLAAENGRSMEAEVRAILSDAVAERRKSIGWALREVALKHGGVESLDIPARTEMPRPVEFDE